MAVVAGNHGDGWTAFVPTEEAALEGQEPVGGLHREEAYAYSADKVVEPMAMIVESQEGYGGGYAVSG